MVESSRRRTAEVRERRSIKMKRQWGLLGLLVLVPLEHSAAQVSSPTSTAQRATRAPPPESNVTPAPQAPTTAPGLIVSDVPSPVPSLDSSAPPTTLPTAAVSIATTTTIETARPSARPSQRPSANKPTRRPTRRPTRDPTGPPSRAPTGAPSEPQPTLAPTIQPTPEPSSTMAPTSGPTQGPTGRPSSTMAPTDGPTLRPSPLPTVRPTVIPTIRTASPTKTVSSPINETSLVPASVPILFSTEVISAQPSEQLVDEVEPIWESYILARLQSAYRNDETTFVQDVNLNVVVVGEEPLDGGVRQLRRASLTMDANGAAEFTYDASQMNQQEFEQTASTTMDGIITKSSLQQALLLADNPAVVTAVENEAPAVEEQSKSTAHVPTLAEMIIGFALLFFVILSLLFWARVWWLKRQKALKKRALERQRAQTSYTIGGSAKTPPRNTVGGSAKTPPRTIKTSSPSRSAVMAMPTTTKEDSSDSDSEYKGLSDDAESEYESDVSEFGRELQRAASLDRKAWEEFQRKKMELEAETRGLGRVEAAKPTIIGVAERKVAMYGSTASQGGEGIEAVDTRGLSGMPVNPVSSFPYGDERGMAAVTRKQEELELTLNDAVEWTPNGISLRVPEEYEDGGEFEPYGDSKKKSLQESWDLDAVPVEDTDGPSAYSFLYPLRRQQLSDNTKQSTPTITSDSETSNAVRASPNSWSTGAAVASVSKVAPSPSPPEVPAVSTDDSSAVDSATSDGEDPAEMLKEVARLTAYVKSYEQRKQYSTQKQREAEESLNISSINASALHPPSSFTNSSMMTQTSTESRSLPSASYQALNDSSMSSISRLPPPRKDSKPVSASQSPAKSGLRLQPRRRVTDLPSAKPVPPSRKYAGLFPVPQRRRPEPAVEREDPPATAKPGPKKSGPIEWDPDKDPVEQWKQSLVDSPDSDAIGHRLPTMSFSAEDEDDPSLGPLDSTSGSSVDDDEQSQRLGISRFTVQRPTVPMLSFKQAEAEDDPDTDPLPSPPNLGPSPAAATVGASSRFNSRPLGRAGQSFAELSRPMAASRSGLASMRANTRPVMDGTVASEETGSVTNASSAPFDERRSRQQATAEPQMSPPSQRESFTVGSFKLSPRTRSKNVNFNNIVSMFESKPHTSVKPPDKNWHFE